MIRSGPEPGTDPTRECSFHYVEEYIIFTISMSVNYLHKTGIIQLRSDIIQDHYTGDKSGKT
jgi:hypothetical protein